MKAEDWELDAPLDLQSLQAMYDYQCALTDEWAERYRAEVERKADATLIARIAELERHLERVNKRLVRSQRLTFSLLQQRNDAKLREKMKAKLPTC